MYKINLQNFEHYKLVKIGAFFKYKTISIKKNLKKFIHMKYIEHFEDQNKFKDELIFEQKIK